MDRSISTAFFESSSGVEDDWFIPPLNSWCIPVFLYSSAGRLLCRCFWNVILLQAVSMLLLNHKMLATEAWENGLVVEVLKAGNFMEQVNHRVKSLAAMSNKVLAVWNLTTFFLPLFFFLQVMDKFEDVWPSGWLKHLPTASDYKDFFMSLRSCGFCKDEGRGSEPTFQVRRKGSGVCSRINAEFLFFWRGWCGGGHVITISEKDISLSLLCAFRFFRTLSHWLSAPTKKPCKTSTPRNVNCFWNILTMIKCWSL